MDTTFLYRLHVLNFLFAIFVAMEKQNDAQNLFEDWTSHQGVSSRAGYVAAHLIGSGVLPEFIIVGIDGARPFRSLNFCPYPPGSGKGDFRSDAARFETDKQSTYYLLSINAILANPERFIHYRFRFRHCIFNLLLCACVCI